MAAERVTYLEYLEWMALSPRTNSWSAFVAYDRDKCNHLLRQEYIEKFDNDSYMPPIDEPYLSGETTWHWQLDYVTDAPRLSFENNANDDTSAEANMSMAVVGGTVVHLTDRNGAPEVTMVSSFDPLDHPELSANRVLLKDIKGQVDEAGAVVLDLGDPDVQRYTWELKGSRIECERKVGGAFFKRKFRELRAVDPQRTQFKLGELAYTEQDFLKPSVFKLRTVMEKGAQIKNAANYGNGAVEIRIAMKDEPQGGLPGDDWLYPIPSDLPGIDSSLMFSHEQLMLNILARGTAQAFGAENAEFEKILNNKGFVTQLKVKGNTEGYLVLPAKTFDYDDHIIEVGEIKIPIYINKDHLLTLTNYGNGRCRVGMGSYSDYGQTSYCRLDGKEYPIYVTLGLNASYLFSIDSERRVVVELVESEFNAPMHISLQGYVSDMFDRFILSDTLQQYKNTEVKKAAALMFANLQAIDAFVLHSLLFNSTDAVHLKSVDVPGDLVSFGSISPRLTTFTIDPVEMLLGYGATHTFKTFPETPGVKWEVKNLDGTSQGAGQIDVDSGRYTAPGLDDITGTYNRVKITATGPTGHVSKALVTVAARAITLNPLVQTCPASDESLQTRQLSANTLNGTLKWSVIGEGSIAETANPDRTNVYTAPPKHDVAVTKKTFTVDEVKVTNTTTQQTQSSLVVVTHDRQTLSMSVELLGEHQAKFSAKSNGQDAPMPVWGCFPETGAGEIDEDGLYSADPNSHYQFVIITVRSEIAGYFVGDAFYIQPLPLKALPPKPAPEEPQP